MYFITGKQEADQDFSVIRKIIIYVITGKQEADQNFSVKSQTETIINMRWTSACFPAWESS